MAGTIITDRIESDASYASSITVASPMVVANTISMSGAGGSISGNVNFDSGTLFVDSVNNRVGVGGITNPSDPLHVVKSSGTTIGRFQHTTTNGGNIAIQTPSYEIAFGIDSSGGAYVNTGSANRLLIDSSGRVTKPYQPAFHARVAIQNYITTSPIPFSDEVFDVGGNFNTSTYRFTAPIAGKYFMVADFYLRVDGGGQDAYPRYRVNGTQVQYTYVYKVDASRMDATLSMNRIFDLAAGDYVDIVFQGTGSYFAGTSETNWYGWLIA